MLGRCKWDKRQNGEETAGKDDDFPPDFVRKPAESGLADGCNDEHNGQHNVYSVGIDLKFGGFEIFELFSDILRTKMNIFKDKTGWSKKGIFDQNKI